MIGFLSLKVAALGRPLLPVLLVLLATCSGDCASERLKDQLPDKEPIFQEKECGYSGFNYSISEYLGDTNSVGDRVETSRYIFGDLVPSKYDTERLRSELQPIMTDWQRRYAQGAVFPPGYKEPAMFFLCAEYEFNGSPDMVLLRYAVRLVREVVFVGLVKSSGKWYILTDRVAGSLRDNFSRMIEENDGCLSLQPVCTATLLVSLTYGYRPLFVLNSHEDLKSAARLMYFPLPEIWEHQRNYLYFMGTDWIPDLQQKIAAIKERRDHWMVWMGSEDALRDTISYDPPSVENFGDDSTVVRLTVYDHYSGEVARWRVALSETGRVISMGYVGKPISYVVPLLAEAVKRTPYWRGQYRDTTEADKMR
jgi:hypothetical protein